MSNIQDEWREAMEQVAAGKRAEADRALQHAAQRQENADRGADALRAAFGQMDAENAARGDHTTDTTTDQGTDVLNLFPKF